MAMARLLSLSTRQALLLLLAASSFVFLLYFFHAEKTIQELQSARDLGNGGGGRNAGAGANAAGEIHFRIARGVLYRRIYLAWQISLALKDLRGFISYLSSSIHPSKKGGVPGCGEFGSVGCHNPS